MRSVDVLATFVHLKDISVQLVQLVLQVVELLVEVLNALRIKSKFAVDFHLRKLRQIRVKSRLVNLVAIFRVKLHDSNFVLSSDLHSNQFDRLVQVQSSALNQTDKAVRFLYLSLHKLICLLHDLFLLVVDSGSEFFKVVGDVLLN